MNFESELKKGNFVIGTCIDCDRVVWPPSNLCNSCFGKITWKKASLVGKLIEYSKKMTWISAWLNLKVELELWGILF